MSQRFCAKCGASAAPEDRFCVKCGTPVPPAPPVPTAAPVPWTGHTAPIKSLAISRDGSRLLSGSEDSTVRLWETATGRELLCLKLTFQVSSAIFSPDEHRVAVAGGWENLIRMYDLARTTCLMSWLGHKSLVTGLAWSADGRTVWSASWDQTVRGWDASTGLEIHRLEGHTDYVDCVAVSPDGQWVASGATDETVRLWNGHTGQPVAVIRVEGRSVVGYSAVAFSPDSQLLVGTSLAAEIAVWDVSSTEIVRLLEGHIGNIFAVAWSPDGQKIASAGGSDFHDEELKRDFGSDNSCRVWDLASGREIQRYVGHTGNVNAIVFSPDGSTCFSAGKEGVIHRWSVNR